MSDRLEGNLVQHTHRYIALNQKICFWKQKKSRTWGLSPPRKGLRFTDGRADGSHSRSTQLALAFIADLVSDLVWNVKTTLVVWKLVKHRLMILTASLSGSDCHSEPSQSNAAFILYWSQLIHSHATVGASRWHHCALDRAGTHVEHTHTHLIQLV